MLASCSDFRYHSDWGSSGNLDSLTEAALVTIQHLGFTPARARRARCIGICTAAILLSVALAQGETIDSYYLWQWKGFIRTSPVSTNGPSSSSSLVASLDAASNESSGSTSLSGVVYYDTNGNGVRDTDDYGIRDALLTLTTSDSTVSTRSSASGGYSFSDLSPGTYAIALSIADSNPGTITVGTITDAEGNTVTTGRGVAGIDTITDIVLEDNYTGVNYDFGQLSYPLSLISKRLLLNTDTGLTHTSTGGGNNPPPVPEPGTLVLLAVAGLFFAGRVRRR
jgi:hypothetical protein